LLLLYIRHCYDLFAYQSLVELFYTSQSWVVDHSWCLLPAKKSLDCITSFACAGNEAEVFGKSLKLDSFCFFFSNGEWETETECWWWYFFRGSIACTHCTCICTAWDKNSKPVGRKWAKCPCTVCVFIMQQVRPPTHPLLAMMSSVGRRWVGN